MSLQSLKSSIEEITKQKASALIEEATKEAERIVEEAKRKAEELREKAIKARKDELEAIEKSVLSIEELQWKKKILGRKAEILEKIFSEAERRIAQMAGESAYRSFLKNVAAEGIMRIPASEYLIIANKRDSEVLGGGLKEIEEEVQKAKRSQLTIEISDDHIDSLGGVLVSDKNMREYYNNTIEARISQSKMRLKGQFYRELFGGE